jgi:cytochrome P450
MFDELRYRWALRKFLKEHQVMRRHFEDTPDDPEVPAEDEPRYKFTMAKELNFQEVMIDGFRSKYLVEQAYRYHVPITHNEDDWMQPRGASEPYLTAEAAQNLRADIRAEQKADWDYWATRVTLALALIGSIFGVLAFFKK